MTLGDSQVSEAVNKPLSLSEKLAAAKAKLANQQPQIAEEKKPQNFQQPEMEYPAEDLVEDDDTGPQKYQPRDSHEAELDAAIKNLDIVKAYNMWCGKSVPKVGRKTESIMVSCPDPAHPDVNPDAWLNTDKNVWYCGPCQKGGDAVDIAAYHYGFPVPGYKNGSMFRDLKAKIASDLGFVLVQGMTQTYLVAPEQEEDKKSTTKKNSDDANAGSVLSEEAPSDPADSSVNNANVEEAPADSTADKDPFDFDPPTIDWRSIVPRDTFLYNWLETNTTDYCPEEYHFWTGMMALGFAVGRNRMLWDSRYVTGNLFMCLAGPSGTGKSIAKERLEDVCRLALPYDDTSVHSQGTKIIKSAASAEYLVHEFSSSEPDPMNPTNPPMYYPVRGLVDYEELSTLMAMANRVGNPIKPQLMDLYDSRMEVSSGSITGGRRKAVEPFCQVMSTTQFDSLAKLLSKGDDGSGFINRWIFASGKAKKRPALGGVVIDLKPVAKDLLQIKKWANHAEIVQWSIPGRQAFEEFFYEKIVPLQEKSEKAGTAMMGRIDLLMKKFILLLAINKMEAQVSAQTVNDATELLPYIMKTYGVVHRQMNRTENNDIRDEIVRQIIRLTKKNKNKPPTKREIWQAVHRKLKDDKQLVDILTNLVKLELITETVVKPATGRPTTRYGIQ